LYFRHVCALGLEGIVSKKLGSRYVSGRSQDWHHSEKKHAYEALAALVDRIVNSVDNVGLIRGA
jgi:ATP-dependent DNA ligase